MKRGTILLFALLSMIFFSSCVTASYHSPDTVEPGHVGVSVSGSYFSSVNKEMHDLVPGLAKGFFGTGMLRYGVLKGWEIGLKGNSLEQLFYTKHKLVGADGGPFGLTLIGEAGMQRLGVPMFTAGMLASYEVSDVAEPFFGLRNVGVVGSEWYVFDIDWEANFIGGVEIAPKGLPVSFMIEADYVAKWYALHVGTMLVSLGLNFTF